MGYTGGKKSEPTQEELEFIYSRIRFLSDSEIVQEIQDETTFPPRTVGFVKRRRKEFNAAKRVLEVEVKKELDPATARIKVKHWIDLAEAAEKLRRNIELVRARGGDIEGNILSGSILSASTADLFGTKHKTPLVKVDKMDARNLLTHLKLEYDRFSAIHSWERLSKWDITGEGFDDMLKKLATVSHRRWFMGSCRVCNPWSTSAKKMVSVRNSAQV